MKKGARYNMSARKKFVIALTSLSLVFVVAVVGLVLVLSASIQTTKAVVKVRYRADKVSAVMTTRYALYDTDGNISEDGVQTMRKANGDTSLAFGPSETDEGVLAPDGEINLSKQYRQVVFEFIFENKSSTISINVESLAFPKAENVKVYKYLTTDNTSYLGDTNETIKQRMSTLSTSKETVIKVAINTNGTYRIYIIVEIDKLLYDASYETTEEDGYNGFAWSLTRATAES